MTHHIKTKTHFTVCFLHKLHLVFGVKRAILNCRFNMNAQNGKVTKKEHYLSSAIATPGFCPDLHDVISCLARKWLPKWSENKIKTCNLWNFKPILKFSSTFNYCMSVADDFHSNFAFSGLNNLIYIFQVSEAVAKRLIGHHDGSNEGIIL